MTTGFKVHYLDSPEQALLVTPVYSSIQPRGGGTFIAPDGVKLIANYLAQHPEGVLPTGLSFTPSTSTYEDPKDHPEYWSHLKEIKRCKEFVELTGEPGDVVLMHPVRNGVVYLPVLLAFLHTLFVWGVY